MDELDKLYELALEHGVRIYPYELGEAAAATVKCGDQYAIALHPGKNRSRREELCHLGHELGHVETGTLHRPGADEQEILRCEYRSAAWMAARLVPAEELLRAVKAGYTEVWELAEYFGVTEECILDAVKIYRNRGLL